MTGNERSYRNKNRTRVEAIVPDGAGCEAGKTSPETGSNTIAGETLLETGSNTIAGETLPETGSALAFLLKLVGRSSFLLLVGSAYFFF